MTRGLRSRWALLTTAGLLAGLLALVPTGAQADHLSEHGLQLEGVTEVVGGWMHSCALTLDGEVYCWGNNATGNLGDGTAATVRPVPKRVEGIGEGPVRQISAGADHTCALSDAGEVWCWGGNLVGQLGGVPADLGLVRRTPGKVSLEGRTFISVSAGNSHTCALEHDGTPWCWGSNGYGQLGHDVLFDGVRPPERVHTLDMGQVRTLVAGAVHSCAVNVEEELWCWGNNSDGRLGDGTTEHALAPVQVRAANGFPGGGITALALGSYHTCVSTRVESVYCWGDNTYGRVGNPTGDDSHVPIRVGQDDGGLFEGAIGVSAGLDHSCAWKADGSAWCWGRAVYGQIGDGVVTTSRPVPKWPVTTRTLLSQALGHVVQVSNGYSHTCSVNTVNLVHCWGNNLAGQLGDGTFVSQKVPSRVFAPPL